MGTVFLKRFWHKTLIVAVCLLLNVFTGFANVNLINKNAGNRQQVEINGKVTDETGKPLVDVTVKNETKSTVINTDIEGDYFIDAEKGNVLSFAVSGFEVKNVVVGGDKVINVVLQESVAI